MSETLQAVCRYRRRVAAVQRELFIHGHRIAYRQRGELEPGRPVVVLVHGLAGSSGNWLEVMSRFSDGVVVVAPDLPGFGHSDKPRQDYSIGAHASALRDVMVALGIARATVIGHSLGGGVAMQFAYQHPERCERLVLISSGGLGPDVSWMLRLLSLPGAELVLPVIAPSLVRHAGNAVARGMGRLGIRWPHVEQSWRAFSSLAEAENRQPFLRTLRAVVGASGQVVSARDRLYLAAHLPTLILWGGRDRMVPVGHAEVTHAALPGSQLVVFDRCGHFPHNEEPDAFVRTVENFLATTAPAEWDETAWRSMLSASP